MRRLNHVLVLVLTCISMGTGFCSPTGLNLIPTADTLDRDVYRIDVPWSGGMQFGPRGSTYALMQIGAGNGMEVGLDQSIENGQITAWMNAKWKFLEEEGSRPAVAIGVLNVSRNTQEQPYLVMSKNIKPVRLHAGAIKINEASRTMFGLSKSLNSKLTVQADYISGRENSFSAGFAMKLADGAAVWAARSFSNSSANNDEYFVRLGWSARF